MTPRGRGSGAPMIAEAFWQLCTVRDNKISRVINYADRAEAFEDEGLQK